MSKPNSRLQNIRARVAELLDENMSGRQDEPSRLRKFIHFWVLVWKSFQRNRCPVRASALSFVTLLALIPMLAVAMSVTTSVLRKQGQQEIERVINNFVSYVMPPTEGTETNSASTGTNATAAVTAPTNDVAGSLPANPPPDAGQDEQAMTPQKKVAGQISAFVQNAQRTGAITGLGAIFLIIAAIQMMMSIEATFNDIWGVTRGRPWALSIMVYWLVITLGPVLLASALGLAGGPHLQTTRKLLMHMPVIGGFIFRLLPFPVLWLTFALFYMAVPNTRVRFNAALAGGVVAGTLWHLNNLFGFLYVSRYVSSTKIYGDLGLIPVFMFGLYLSWLILLFGAQVAYAYQNRKLYLQEKLVENVNQRGREFVSLRLITCIGYRFQHGLPAPTIQQMSDELAIPSRLAQQVLQTLMAAHLVVEVSGAESGYAPSRPLEDINAHHVLQAMRITLGQEIATRDEPVRAEIYGEFARIQEAEKEAARSINLLDLVNRARARLTDASQAKAESASR